MSSLRRKTAMKRTHWSRKNNPTRRAHDRNPNATGWTQRVFALYGRRCLVCNLRRASQAHHVVPAQRIRKADHLDQEERDALEFDARNGLPICEPCHQGHELASARIPYSRLKSQHLAWAMAWGFASTIKDARIYPRKAA